MVEIKHKGTGERLLAVDGRDTTEMGLGAVRFLMEGKSGTSVPLTVETPGAGAPRALTLTREAFRPRPPAPPPK